MKNLSVPGGTKRIEEGVHFLLPGRQGDHANAVMLETIREIIYQVTGKKNITYDTDFVRDLELNSFDIMNIVAEFEDTFEISIPTRDVWHLNQVKDAIDYLHKRGVKDSQ